VYIPHLKKSASIVRTIKKAKQPQITPNEPDIKAVFADVAEHPEITLSRREIIKFILTEATQRSRDVQTLLKLDDIDQTRGTLKTAENKLNGDYATARSQSETADDSLKRHLDLPALKAEDILTAVNKRRTLLSLPAIPELTKDTVLSDGLMESAKQAGVEQSKESALADLNALSNVITSGFESQTRRDVKTLLADIAKIERDQTLLPLIKRYSFLQTGLEFVDGPNCPLCDAEWDIDGLKSHVRGKLERAKEAQAIRDRMMRSGQVLSDAALRLNALIAPVTKFPESAQPLSTRLGQLSGELTAFAKSLSTLDGLLAAKESLESGWTVIDNGLKNDLDTVLEKIKARPEKSATVEAGNFLVIAEERWRTRRFARRTLEEKKLSAARGRTAYKTYVEVSEAALVGLYEDVEGEFGSYYRFINQDDEGEFKAKFEAADGKLGLLVDFHKKGMFPPGAYHSEGHQDGMGVCLYLALMKRVLGKDFTFAVLDDVVMSVDSQHRKQFCRLLKTNFPNTQFVITTHDRVWAKQLRSEGVAGSKSAVEFHTWTVETGPILDEVAEVWQQIDADLAKNDVPAAAGRLRRHLEYVAADLADDLGAKVKFRSDGGYDMGELLSAVIGRQGELLKMAAKAAKSWGDGEQIAKVAELQKARQEILIARGSEEWVINKAIHYNEWADLSRNDFKPVVVAFKDLLQQFRCSKPKCDSWLSLNPRHEPLDLRCSCGALNLNLKEAGSIAASRG
jgi:hypothetical protein